MAESEGSEDNLNNHREMFFERILRSDLSVNSGVYSVVDPSLSLALDDRGAYRYLGLDLNYEGPFEELLRVSAFGGIAADESATARRLFGGQPGIQEDPVAGFYRGAFAGSSADDGIRRQASSGGITTWLLLELLKHDLIDGVLHMTASGGPGPLFKYSVSRTPAEVLGGAKTRYYPGEMSNSLEEVLATPGRYAVVGIPSMIYEIRLLQQLKPLFAERIRYTVGLICGHQKTAAYADSLAWQVGIAPGDLESIDFRKKVAGKPANSYSTQFTGRIHGERRTFTTPQTSLFGTDWGWGALKANFSDFTQDAFNETADIVLGDAWLPRYVSDSRGTNVVITRNNDLHDLLAAGSSRGELNLDELPISEVIRSQGSLVRQSVTELPYRFDVVGSRGEYCPPMRRAPQKISARRKRIQRARLELSRKSSDAFLSAIRATDLASFIEDLRPLVARYRRAQELSAIQAKVAEGPVEVVRAAWRRIS